MLIGARKMKKKCERCGKITEYHPIDDYCLECDDDPASVAILKRITQYKDWTGDEDWTYNPIEYDRVASERMYRMAVDGHSVSEIASEIYFPRSGVISLVLDYCRRNGLEIPLKKHKIVRKKKRIVGKRKRKPNGLFCLACNRPLVGNQRKWCGHDDCEGWDAIHPRIVRQCSVCMNITETYAGSGYETVCQGCTNFPEDSKQRTKEWIARERASAEFMKENRAKAYDDIIWDVTRECEEDVFFGYLKIDFNRGIITPVGKKSEDMFEIVRDIQKAWELCNPMWSTEALSAKIGIEIKPTAMMCPVFSPSLKGPNGISCLLAPLEDWVVSVDMFHWQFNMQGDFVTFLSMSFSDWLQREYVENKRTIEEIAHEVNTTTYRVEYALNELSIPLRARETFE
jgi:hypothetical protein